MGLADWLRRRAGDSLESDDRDDEDEVQDGADAKAEGDQLEDEDDPTTYPLW